MRILTLISFALFCVMNVTMAQPDTHLSLDFNGSTYEDQSSKTNAFSSVGSFSSTCGVFNDAAILDGNDSTVIVGDVNNFFEKNDLTVSFYFQPTAGASGTQTILSKRNPDCSNEGVFEILYDYDSNSFLIELSANNFITASFTIPIERTNIFQHLILNRDGRVIRVYLNGNLAEQQNLNTVINLFSFSELHIGSNPCNTSTHLEGILDELIISSGDFNRNTLNDLYLQQGEILNRLDTIIYLGDGVQISLSPTCANTSTWTPDNGIQNINSFEPFIEPTEAGDFTYIYTGQKGRYSEVDSIRIRVIDPDLLECEAFFPNAFTPNGDNLNDVFRLVNKIAVTNLIVLEIFDQWGNRIFSGNGLNTSWNGTIDGIPAPPGAYFYRSTFLCEDEKKYVDGTVTIVR